MPRKVSFKPYVFKHYAKPYVLKGNREFLSLQEFFPSLELYIATRPTLDFILRICSQNCVKLGSFSSQDSLDQSSKMEDFTSFEVLGGDHNFVILLL